MLRQRKQHVETSMPGKMCLDVVKAACGELGERVHGSGIRGERVGRHDVLVPGTFSRVVVSCSQTVMKKMCRNSSLFVPRRCIQDEV